MDVESSSQQLVHEILAVVVGQVLSRVDDSVHIGLHQVSDDVDVLIPSRSWGLLHVNQFNDVLVIKEL